MSPNHPNNYPNNYNKVFFFLITFVLKNYVKVITLQTWQLQSGQEFTLTFDSFDIWRCIKDGENQLKKCSLQFFDFWFILIYGQ